MNILIFLMIVYPLWAIPLHLVWNFFITRALLRNKPALAAWSIALAVNVLLFTPLLFAGGDFFGAVFVPWYLAPLLMPPSPAFSWTGLMITGLLSASGSALWIALWRRRH